MEKSGFFADIEGDRGYTDDFLAEWVASFIENGVYNTELGVMAAGDMNITVQPGRAWINGRIYILTEALTIPVEVSDGKLNRYTSIVLRADANARKITVQAVDGTYSAQPTAPNVTRNSEIYELKLADIYVAAGAISISQAEITDTRLDNEVCGLVYCPVEHIDTESLYNQIQTDLTNFRNISQKEFDAWFSAFISSANGNISEYENSFLVWFEHMKDQLSEDAAGNLQLQIDNLNNAALGGGFVVKGDAVSLEYVSENRIDTITAYGETPQGGTTDAPVALTGVDSVLLGGNNLLPKATETKTLNGVTFTPNPNGSVSVSGTATNNAAYVFANGLDDSLFGQTVCLSGGSMQTQLVINEKKPSGEWLRNVIINAKTPTAVGVLSKQVDDNILYGTIYVPTGTTVNTTIYPMLNLGSTAMPYEPYQGSVTPLPIPRPLRKVGDVRDVCRTRVKSVYDKRIVLDGTEDWNISSSKPNSFLTPVSERIVNGLSDSYPTLKSPEIGTKNGIYLNYTVDIIVTDLACSTVEEFKAHLSAHPLTVYYRSTAYDGTNGLDVCLTEYQTGYIESYADESITTAWISSTGALSTGAEVAYVLSSPETYATDPLDIDNAAGPLTVMTGGELEVRMTELIGSRSPELAGKMDKATYDADGDGVVDEAEKVSNALTLKNAAGEVVATFDGSEAAILQLTAALVGALGKTEKAADSSKLAGLAPVVDNPGPNNRNTWYFPFTGTNNRDGTRKYYAALYADNATTAGRASNLSMGLNGTDLWVYYS